MASTIPIPISALSLSNLVSTIPPAFCKFYSTFLYHLSSHPPGSTIEPTSAMVHHSMRSRRGGTRGGSSRSFELNSHNSASLASSAKNPCPLSIASHYPNTRSDRGRACLNCSRHAEAVMRTATFPLPLNHIPHMT